VCRRHAAKVLFFSNPHGKVTPQTVAEMLFPPPFSLPPRCGQWDWSKHRPAATSFPLLSAVWQRKDTRYETLLFFFLFFPASLQQLSRSSAAVTFPSPKAEDFRKMEFPFSFLFHQPASKCLLRASHFQPTPFSFSMYAMKGENTLPSSLSFPFSPPSGCDARRAFRLSSFTSFSPPPP